MDFEKVERKWQKRWEDAGIFKVSEGGSGKGKRGKKMYVLEMLPYPSAADAQPGGPRVPHGSHPELCDG